MRKALPLLILLAAFVLTPHASHAQSYTLWHSSLSAVTADSELSIHLGTPEYGVAIYANPIGTYSISIPLFLSSDVRIDAITVCYDLNTSSSYIDEIRLVELTTPNTNAIRLVDTTNLTDDTGDCHTTTVLTTPYPYSPAGAMALELVLRYTGTSHQIEIGAIGVHVTQVSSTSPLP
jgi:hypothetical protein